MIDLKPAKTPKTTVEAERRAAWRDKRQIPLPVIEPPPSKPRKPRKKPALDRGRR
jgi:hypothetical protein